MNELINRLTSESPKFFKKIQALGVTLGIIGGAILLIPENTIHLPAIVDTIAGYFVACGTVAAAIAKTPVANPDDLKK